VVRPVEYGKSIDRWIDIAPNRIGPRNMALQDSAFRPAGQQDERQVIGGHAVRADRNQRGEGLRAHEIVHDFDTVFAKCGRLIHLDFLFLFWRVQAVRWPPSRICIVAFSRHSS